MSGKTSIEEALTGKRGMALLTVLWALSLLSLIAAVLLSSTVASRRDTHAELQQARVEALGEAGLNLAILGLLDPDPNKRWRLDGVPRGVVFDNAQLRITIQDEYGRIDLNAADTSALRQVFVAAGLSQSAADAIADKLLDWRDVDTLRQLNGAEADDYRSAGVGYVPRHGPFQTIDELNLVIGMNEAVFEKLAPLLTVYSHRSMVNPYTASSAVLQAVSGNANQAGAIANGLVGAGMSLVNWPLRVRVEIVEGEAVVSRTETVIRLTDDPSHPLLVQSYREMTVAAEASAKLP
jgi:general secretion pathway protein K